MNDVFLTCGLEIQAAETLDGGKKVCKISGVAYNGGLIEVGYYGRSVVDLSGMEIPESLPLLVNHDNEVESKIGDIAAKIENDILKFSGVIYAEAEKAAAVLKVVKSGGKWQCSIGASPIRLSRVENGEKVNNQDISGNFLLIEKSKLREISIVAVGADEETAVEIQAKQKTGVEKMGVEQNETKEPAVDASATVAKNENETMIAAALNDERKRVKEIQAVCAGEFPEIEAEAIENGSSVHFVREKVLNELRAKRPEAKNFNNIEKGDDTAKVMEAALCQSAGITEDKLLKAYGEKTLEAATKKYRRSLSLAEAVLNAAQSNGFTGHQIKGYTTEVLRAAMSNVSLPGILGNVANKQLLASFEAVESEWRKIAAVRTVSDFKTITSYRMTGDMTFEKLAPGATIKHGEVGEESFTNAASRYAKMFVLDEQMLINDDLNAFLQLPKIFGRGSALTLNQVFWTEFLAGQSTFFTTARKNKIASNTLGIDGITAAEVKFMEMTDDKGFPIGVSPKLLVVPVALKTAAEKLMNDTNVENSTKPDTTGNPHKGKFNIVASSYLSNSKITNNSSSNWFLLADPNDLAMIEVAFLLGNQTPVIENVPCAPDQFGIAYRAKYDFGVNKQDYRAAVMNA